MCFKFSLSDTWIYILWIRTLLHISVQGLSVQPNLIEGPYFSELPSKAFSSVTSTPEKDFTSNEIKYYNSTGLILKCKAKGYPEPRIRWLHGGFHESLANISGSFVSQIENLIHQRQDGSLIILPFGESTFREGVHSTVYRCLARNTVGTIISRDFKVKAVFKRRYHLKTRQDVAVIDYPSGIHAIVPNANHNLMTVIQWQRNDGLIIKNHFEQSSENEYIRILNDGTLFFEKVTAHDSQWMFRVTVQDQLDGDKLTSSWTQLVITDGDTFNLRPVIITPYSEYQFMVGSTMQLACIAHSKPPAQYYWFREEDIKSFNNGQQHHPLPRQLISKNPVLVLFDVQVKDSGVFVCLANNTHGEDRQKFKVQVNEPASSIAWKPNGFLRVKEGFESSTLECFAQHYHFKEEEQKMRLEWLKDGLPLIFDARRHLIDRNKLRIGPVKEGDKGMYQCLLVNSKEIVLATESIQVTLYEQDPRLEEMFYPRTTYPGTELKLKCSASGSPLPTVQWYHYQKRITMQSNKRIHIIDFVQDNNVITSILNITNLLSSDGGLFTCVATNRLSQDSHSAVINVFGETLVHQMKNMTVATGDRLQIRCPVSGYPIDSVVWQKEAGDNIKFHHVKALENGTISFLDIGLQDKGWYFCTAKGPNGDMSSNKVYIDVIEKPNINPFLFGSALREGMRTTVVCSVYSGDLPIRITWSKNGGAAQEAHPEIEITSYTPFTSSLTISKLQRKHSGNYTCKAESINNGKIYSEHTSTLTVQAAPQWIVKPADSHLVMKGKNLIIDCQAEGIPPPIHQWKKREVRGKKNGSTFLDHSTTSISSSSSSYESTAIVSGPHIYVLENGSLAISNANKSDEAEYVCDVNNGIGSPLTASTEVKIYSLPYFHKGFQPVNAKRGHSVELMCHAFGDPPLNISWLTNGDAIHSNTAFDEFNVQTLSVDEGTISRLIIQKVHLQFSFFVCRASNAFGSDEMVFQLKVVSPPSPPLQVKAIAISSREAKISWIPPPDGNSPLQSYLVHYIKCHGNWAKDFGAISVAAKTVIVVVPNLLPSNCYRMRIIAQNEVGDSEPSATLEFVTEEEAPNERPTDVSVQGISAESIRVDWRYRREDSIGNTSINGFKIGFRDASGLSSNFDNSKDSYFYKKVDSMATHAILTGLRRSTKYGIIVQAYNSKGVGPASEEITFQTAEYDPPNAIVPQVHQALKNSLTLMLKADNQNPIAGFLIRYKTENGEWEQQNVLGKKHRFSLDNLRCGTKYQISITGYNKAGQGKSSEVLTAFTAGSVPLAPNMESLIQVNSTFVILRLSAWKHNECPIISFIVQYKLNSQPNWILFSNNVVPEQEQVLISDLFPGSWYDLVMIAQSEAGHVEAHYLFATLKLDGGTIPPPSAVINTTWDIIMSDPALLLPFFSIIIVAIAVFISFMCLSSNGCKADFTSNSEPVWLSDDDAASNKREALSLASYPAKSAYFEKDAADTYRSTFPPGPCLDGHYGDLVEVMESRYGVHASAGSLETPQKIKIMAQMQSSNETETHVYDLPQRGIMIDSKGKSGR